MTTPFRPKTPVYRIGDTKPFFTLATKFIGGWSERSFVIADYFGCDQEDVGSHESDDGTELITIAGQVVGSFDRPIEAKDGKYNATE